MSTAPIDEKPKKEPKPKKMTASQQNQDAWNRLCLSPCYQNYLMYTAVPTCPTCRLCQHRCTCDPKFKVEDKVYPR